MSKLSNTLLLLSYLQNGRKYSINELAKKLEVSPRMIRSYKEELEQAGFIIETIYGPYGGYILKKNTINLSSSFNENDLNMINKLLATNNNDKYNKYLSTLSDKIKTIINKTSKETITNDIQNIYNTISYAIKEKRKVEITYNSLEKGLNTRIIEPLELFYLKNGFGVAAFCETKKDLRHFELKRIEKIKILNEYYQ